MANNPTNLIKTGAFCVSFSSPSSPHPALCRPCVIPTPSLRPPQVERPSVPDALPRLVAAVAKSDRLLSKSMLMDCFGTVW
ncbi:hypothetical protein GCM10022254_32040 [Actinomadura meridiana]|uniref:Uncharacterized protein n=1 Tax=Actinomadura meridiana TaxID=559626 RepID=A0ABP8C380_9ACTN